MINITTMWDKFKNIVIIVLLIATVWIWKSWEFQKSENIRQTENLTELRKVDSLHFARQIMTSNELKEHLLYQNSDLKNKLVKAGIKEKRVTEIVTNNYGFKDTIKQETDISKIIESVKTNIPKAEEWIDKTQCLTIKGTVLFDGSKLKVIVNDREFKNTTNAVAYWERNQWNFLGLKTRFLGKKQFTAKVFDDCGESQILRIEKKQ